MQFQLSLLVLVFLTALGRPARVRAQDTGFNYQGRLAESGVPASGTYDFIFTVHDAISGGDPLTPAVTANAVPVTAGQFTVPLDFGAGAFTGAARWLQVSVRAAGVGDHTLLTPRQPLLPTPYALFAGRAGRVADGTVTATQLGTVGPAPGPGQFLSYDGGNLTWTAPGVAAGNIWSRLGANAYYNAGNVGIGTASPATKLTVQTGSGNYGFTHTDGTITLGSYVGGSLSGAVGGWLGTLSNHPLHFFVGGGQPALTLAASGSVGIGTNSPTAGYRLEVVGAAVLRPGNGSIQYGSPNGELGMSITPNIGNRADLRFDGAVLKLLAGTGVTPPSPLNGITINTAGNVGIGKASANFKLEVSSDTTTAVVGRSTVAGGTGVYGESTQFNGVRGVANNASHGAVVGVHNNAGIGVLGQSTGVGIYGNSLGGGAGVFGESAQSEGVRGLAHHASHGGVVGVHDGGGIAVYGTGATGIQGDSSAAGGVGGFFRNTAGGLALKVQGTAQVGVLEITGGADVAEPFPMSHDAIPKGAVVVIDAEHPGHLKASDRAYDPCVAGIVSGANGVNPGISLHQQGVLEGGQNVSLSGRVYVLADASTAAIRPGDALTSSDVPGHAMKVTDPSRASGAILGKAMTPLKSGRGMVLVLVTLQ